MSLYVKFAVLRVVTILLVVFLWAVCSIAATKADEKADRDRAARVALALAGTKAAPAAAPAPRPAAKCYGDGYAKAVSDVQPLVVFVGCRSWPVEGAVVARADQFADVKAPAVVIGYPVGDRLFIDATLPNADVPAVDAAVKAAQKKIDVPPTRKMPAPKPLNWNL